MKQWLQLCLFALPAVGAASSCVNGPQSRQCWKDGFDISTDYEAQVPPGKLVEYDFTLSNAVMAPDGYLTNVTVVNGRYPGPTIEADWGDTLRVTIHNNLTNDNGTAFHWHGIRQFQTNYLDGVPGVNQCPIKPGDSQTYEFKLMQYGMSWYHSHFSLQYTNGANGAIHIKGPTSGNYDEDLGPWIMSDWYHSDAFELYPTEILTPQAPIPETNVLNGKGVFNCTPSNDTRCTGKQDYYSVTFQRGTKYKIGLVNTGSLLTYKFWIDGHNFTVVQNDFVPIKPYQTNVLAIGIGQRYEIIIEANADDAHGSNFWIHANYCNEDTWESRLAIIRYNPKNTSLPYTPPVSQQHYGFGCQDPAPQNLVPIVPRQVGNRVNSMEPYDYLKIGLINWPNINDNSSTIRKWTLMNRTMQLDWSTPSLQQYISGKPNFTEDQQPITLDYNTGEWVYFVIINNYTLSTHPPRMDPPSVHPIHLHGHDFVILAQGEGPFHRDIEPNLNNPTRRDVADCPIGGFVWIAFQVNNPGAWLMHCHIAWHASAGLSLQYLEQPSKIKPLMQQAGIIPEFQQRCDAWTKWYNTKNKADDELIEDSGI